MSFNYSPKIVTDGLIYYLDSANSKSFISGNTQWNSMDVNKNFVTLQNGPQYLDDFKGIIRFDGTDDSISASQLFSPSIRNGDVSGETPDIDFELTFEIVFRLLETISAGTITNFFRTSASGTGLKQLPLYRTSLTPENNFISGAGYRNTGATDTNIFSINEYEINKWHHVTMSMRKTSATTGEWLLIRNGNILEQQTLTDISWWGNYRNILNDDGNQIAQSPNTNFFQHDKAIMRVYRKGLTLDECLQNYNALKKRFKLE